MTLGDNFWRNRFHVDMHQFSVTDLKLRSKYGKNKNEAHQVIGKCVNDVLTTI